MARRDKAILREIQQNPGVVFDWLKSNLTAPQKQEFKTLMDPGPSVAEQKHALLGAIDALVPGADDALIALATDKYNAIVAAEEA